MITIRLTLLTAFLAWAFTPFVFNGPEVDGQRVVGGAFGLCKAPVACPACAASPLSCPIQVSINGQVSCVCNSTGSSDGCTGAMHPYCGWSCWPTNSCGANTCGNQNLPNCPGPNPLTGCGTCSCVPVPTSPCPEKC